MAKKSILESKNKSKNLSKSEKINKEKIKSKTKAKWIYLAAGLIIVVVALVLVLVNYYFNIYLTKPNFDDLAENFISSPTSQTVKPGDIIEYVVKYKNTGNRSVNDFTVEVPIPSNTTFVSSNIVSSNPESNDNSSNSGDKGENKGSKLVFKIGTVLKWQGGEIAVKVKVNRPLDNETEIKLSSVKFNYKIKDESFELNVGPQLSNIVKSSPNLENFSFEAVDTNGGEFRLSDTLKYKIKLENTGDMNASNVEIKSNISEYLDIIEGSISKNGSITGNAITWKIDTLEVDTPIVLQFSAKPKEGVNKDTLITTKGFLKYGDFSLEKQVQNQLVLYPDLSASECFLYDENGGRLWPGEVINVKVVIKNTGEKMQESYKLICPIPKGATYISKSGNPEGIRWSDDIRGLIWDLHNLDVGQQKEINFKMTVDESLVETGGTITTNFKIKTNTQEIELPKKSIKVSGKVKLNIVAMGDSLIARSNWVSIFDELLEQRYPHADYNTVPSAKNGELSGQGLARFDSTVAPLKPDIIIIAYGSNDAGFSLSGFRANMESLILKSQNIGARVFINLIGPDLYPGKESYPMYNKVIMELAAKHGAVVIDVVTPLSKNIGAYIQSDGIHYTSEGASVVAHTVFNYVTQYLGDIGQKL